MPAPLPSPLDTAEISLPDLERELESRLVEYERLAAAPFAARPPVSVGIDEFRLGKMLPPLRLGHDRNGCVLHLALVDLLTRHLFDGHLLEGRGLLVARLGREPEQFEGLSQVLFDAAPEQIQEAERELGLRVAGVGRGPQQLRRFAHRATDGARHRLIEV